MKILFVAHCYQNNYTQLIKKLHEKKHEVLFHVASIESTEDHSLIKPLQFKQSKLSVFFESVLKGGVTRKYYFPALYSYWRAFKKQKPDVLIIRDPYKLFSVMATFYALLTKTRIVHYNQGPVSRFKPWKIR